MTEATKTPSLDGWDDFSGEYIKTDLVKQFPVTFVPVSIEAMDRDGKPEMFITFLYNKRDWKLTLNKTNQNFIRSKGLAPKEIIGKKLIFDKTRVRNPSTNSMVDSFILIDIV